MVNAYNVIIPQNGSNVNACSGRAFQFGGTAAKQAKLVEVAQTYLQEHDWPGDWRIDVVAVELKRRGVLERVTVIQNAVGG